MRTTAFAQIVNVQMIGLSHKFDGRRVSLALEDLLAHEREAGTEDPEHKSFTVDLSPDESRGLEVGTWVRVDVRPMSPEDTDALARRQAKQEAAREKAQAAANAADERRRELEERAIEAQERVANQVDPDGKSKPRKKGE